MEDAPVAVGEEVLGDVAHAVGDGEVDVGGGVLCGGVAVEHDEGEFVAAEGVEGVRGHGGGDDSVEGGAGGGEGVAGGAGAVGEG